MLFGWAGDDDDDDDCSSSVVVVVVVVVADDDDPNHDVGSQFAMFSPLGSSLISKKLIDISFHIYSLHHITKCE